MALSKVWVFAETDENGSLTTLSKELLTKARDLGDTVEAFYAGDGNDIAEVARLGEQLLAEGGQRAVLVGLGEDPNLGESHVVLLPVVRVALR